MKTGDELVERILAGEEDISGSLANDLLRECFHEYPIFGLRRLLMSPDTRVIETGIWIVQELGRYGKPLLGDVSRLLKNGVPRIRYLAMNSVLTCASEEDGGTIASAISLISDADANVRWGATQFLMRSSIPQLRAALKHLEESEGEISIATGLRLLVENEGQDEGTSLDMLESSEPVLRRFGLVAALRRRELTERLEMAIRHSEDPEIHELANEELDSRSAQES